jgi:hypothetical protein
LQIKKKIVKGQMNLLLAIFGMKVLVVSTLVTCIMGLLDMSWMLKLHIKIIVVWKFGGLLLEMILPTIVTPL